LVEGGTFELIGQTFEFEGLGWERFFFACFLATTPGMLLLLRVAPWRVKRVIER